MKLLIILLLLSFIGIASAQPYAIYTIVLDNNSNPESGVPVTFNYINETKTLITANDGSVVFSTLNFDISNGDIIQINTKYGLKEITVNYKYPGSGVVYNDDGSGGSLLAALGFTVISLGGGIYYLIRRKK